MLTKIIFLPPNSSSYSCQRCLVLNKSNNALPNSDKELMMVMVMWLMRPTMMKMMLAIFPFWESSENVRDETFVCRSCFEWQVVTMTKVSQNWQNGRQFYRKSWQFRHKKNFPQNCDLDLWFFSLRSRSSSCSLWQGIRRRSMQTFNKQKEIVLSEKKIIVIATDPTKTLAIYIVWSQ